jgi:hypothetical protein
LRLLFWPVALSRPVRAFFYGLPRSRFRTYLVALYYYRLVEALHEGDYRAFLPAVADDAELTFFDLGRYAGRDKVGEALSQWLETTAGATFQLDEFVNPPGNELWCSVSGTGRGVSSGVALELRAYFVIRIEHGMAVRIGIHRDRTAALEAVGQRQ